MQTNFNLLIQSWHRVRAGWVECSCVGIAIDTKFIYVFDKSVMWNLNDYGFFFLHFKI